MTSSLRRIRSDSGFTLIEVLISISLIGILGGVMSQAFVVTLDSSASTKRSLDHSSRRQTLLRYLTGDIQPAQDVWLEADTDVAVTCNGNGPGLKHVLRTHRADGSAHTVAAYFVIGTGLDRRLERMVCTYSFDDITQTVANFTSSEPVVVAAEIGSGPVLVGCRVSVPDLPLTQVCPGFSKLLDPGLTAGGTSVTLDAPGGFPLSAAPPAPHYEIAVEADVPGKSPEIMQVIGGIRPNLTVVRLSSNPQSHAPGSVVGQQPRELIVAVPFKGNADADPACPLPSALTPTTPDPADGCLTITVARRLGSSNDFKLADLEMLSVTAPRSVQVDTEFEIVFEVANNGPDAANSANVTYPLPAGLAFVATPDCTNASGTVICNLGPLPPSAVVTKVVNVIAPAVGVFNHVATTSAGQLDPDFTNNSLSALTVAGSADLEMTAKIAPPSAPLNTNFDYTLQIKNNGPDVATGVAVTDPLPEGIEFVSGTDCSVATGPLVCTFGDLAFGAAASGIVTVKATTIGLKTNTAVVTAGQFDPAPANNSATASTVIGSANLQMVSKTGPASVPIDTNFSFTFQVKNNGPDQATGVTVSDVLPAGVSFVSATNCDDNAGPVMCSLPDLAPNATASKTITVRAGFEGTVTNTATVAALQVDPLTADNRASATTEVTP